MARKTASERKAEARNQRRNERRNAKRKAARAAARARRQHTNEVSAEVAAAIRDDARAQARDTAARAIPVNNPHAHHAVIVRYRGRAELFYNGEVVRPYLTNEAADMLTNVLHVIAGPLASVLTVEERDLRDLA